MATVRELANSLKPLVRRVRRDATAVKGKNGSYWTNEPLTIETLEAHVSGRKARGVCPIKPGETVTSVAMLDMDSHGGETSWSEMVQVLGRLCSALEEAGGAPIPWRSSGGRGVHVYLLWREPQDAYSVRQWLFGVLESVGLKNGCKGVHAGEVEVFPKQDSVPEDGYGNQFILPLAGKSVPLEPLLDFMPMSRDDAVNVKWRASKPVPLAEKPKPVAKAPIMETDLADLRSALTAIPNEDDDELGYDEWRDIIFSIHAATHGSPEGLQLAHEFSARASKYNPDHLENRVWPYIKMREDGITAGTIFAKAMEHGWTRPGAVALPDEFDNIPDESKDDCKEMLQRIASCVDPHVLLDKLAIRAGKIGVGSVAVFNLLASEIRTRFKDLTGNSLPMAELRRAMRPKKTAKTLRDVRHANTEFGNAERMIDKFGDGMMYVPELAQWYTWTGAYWKKATSQEIQYLAQQTIRELPEEISRCKTDEEREAFFRFCAASQRAYMVEAMIKLASSSPRVLTPVTELDADPNLLGVGNGVIDLTTGELLPPDPDMRITAVTDVEYHPDAECPLFEGTLRASQFDDETMVSFIHRLLGYTLLGRPTEDILVIPYGTGANGKSTIFGAVQRVLGQHARTAQAETFLSKGSNGGQAGAAREDILRLRGSRFVYVSEPEDGAELKESMVKSLTGGDLLVARGMYAKSSIEVYPTWVSIMPTNHLPIIKGSDYAIWRRIMAIPFRRNFKEDPVIEWVPGMKEKVLAEAKGILAWLVRGALEYKANGLQPPASVQMARKNYQADMDLLAEWIEECCVLDPTATEATSTLWASWRAFADRHGMLGYIRSSKALGRRLGERFEQARTESGARGWRGIRLQDTNFEEL